MAGPRLTLAMAMLAAGAVTLHAQESREWPMHSMERPRPPEVDPGPFVGSVPPPTDAIVLFDGRSLAEWSTGDAPARWRLGEGYLEVTPGTGSLTTRRSFGDVQLQGIAGESAIALRPAWRDFRAAVIGPGMGDSQDTRAFVWAALPDLAADVEAFVLDADALNALASMPDATQRVPANAILTPHPGEMARLIDSTVAEVQSARLAVAQETASRFGCIVVLKGAHSVVAAPDGRARLSPFANPLLASAGTGDILAGMIGAYLAQGLEPFDAASLGVYLHAATGEALRGELGESGLLASDLAARLPTVTKEIAQP